MTFYYLNECSLIVRRKSGDCKKEIRGGGASTRDIYWWGCALAHQKRGS